MFGALYNYSLGKGSAIKYYMSQALQQLRRFYSATKKYHHEFVSDLSGRHLPKMFGALDSYSLGKGSAIKYMSQALQQSRRFYCATKKYHHELQGFIKQEMQRYEFTAAFVNDELVFFMVCFCFDYLPYTECLDAAVITVQIGQEIFHSKLVAYPEIVDTIQAAAVYVLFSLLHFGFAIKRTSRKRDFIHHVITQGKASSNPHGHIITSPIKSLPLHSQFFVSTQIPCYLNWDFPPILCNKPNIDSFPSPEVWILSFPQKGHKIGSPETS
ncbi:hypothetical protein CRYUN_Cryun31cG0032700 [Craigia yunnanensis]